MRLHVSCALHGCPASVNDRATWCARSLQVEGQLGVGDWGYGPFLDVTPSACGLGPHIDALNGRGI